MNLGLIDGIGSEKEALKYLETNYPSIQGLKIIDIDVPPTNNFFFEEFFSRISTTNIKFISDLTNSLKLISIARWKLFKIVLTYHYWRLWWSNLSLYRK